MTLAILALPLILIPMLHNQGKWPFYIPIAFLIPDLGEFNTS